MGLKYPGHRVPDRIDAARLWVKTNAAAILFGSGRAGRRKFCSIMKWDIRNEFYPETNKSISESEENFKVLGVKVVLILCPAKKNTSKGASFHTNAS